MDRLRKEKELLGFYLTGHPLKEFSEVIQKNLFTTIQDVQDGTIEAIKCACIVESVEIKLSAKSNKKFAIMHISDGDDRAEMLLWSDLLAEFHQLVVENKLLGAVLVVDKRESPFKLQCRYLADLANLGETEEKQLEESYKKAIQLVKLDQSKGKSKKNSAKNDAPIIKKVETLHFIAHADRMRLSHVLDLKKLFDKYPGSQKLKIELRTEKGDKAFIDRDSQNGISIESGLIQELESKSFYHSVSVLD